MTIHAERLTEVPAAPATEPAEDRAAAVADAPLVEQESLVEEISIDGMCGVY